MQLGEQCKLNWVYKIYANLFFFNRTYIEICKFKGKLSEKPFREWEWYKF